MRSADKRSGGVGTEPEQRIERTEVGDEGFAVLLLVGRMLPVLVLELDSRSSERLGIVVNVCFGPEARVVARGADLAADLDQQFDVPAARTELRCAKKPRAQTKP